jgi:N6-adenosine-specific RNA methylase IME4
MSKKYNIIYADPPWSYSDKRGSDKVGAKHGGVNAHYPTMTAEDIKNLDVQSVAADNCMLLCG